MKESVNRELINQLSSNIDRKVEVDDSTADSDSSTYSASKIESEFVRKERFIVPTSIDLIAGTLDSGTVADVQAIQDGNEYHVDEVAATPGFDIRFNFSDVTTLRGFIARLYYNGLSTHEVNLGVYNYATDSWDAWDEVDASTTYKYYYIVLPNSTDYFNSNGNAMGRVYHASAGNPAHDVHIDYIGLVY